MPRLPGDPARRIPGLIFLETGLKQSFNGRRDDGVNPLPPAAGLSGPRTVRSEDLMAGATELVITHAGQAYRLRITRNGKLILTK